MSQDNSTFIINDDNTLFDTQLNIEMTMRTEGIEKMKRSISKNQQTRGESGTEYGHTLDSLLVSKNGLTNLLRLAEVPVSIKS